MNWNILRLLPTYFLHLALAGPLPQEKLITLLSPTSRKLENCLEIDLAQVEELKKQMQNDMVLNESGVSSDPSFGLLEEDWRRLQLLQSRLPEGSILKNKLTHAFRLLIAALYQAHDTLVSTDIEDQEVFHNKDMSETDSPNHINTNSEDAEPQFTVLFDHTNDIKLGNMTTTESYLNVSEELNEIDHEPEESAPKQYVVPFTNYSEPTEDSTEQKTTTEITETSEATKIYRNEEYQSDTINSNVELEVSTKIHSTHTSKTPDTILDLSNASSKPTYPSTIPPQVETLNKDKLNITEGSSNILDNDDETDTSLPNTVMTVPTTRLSSFASFPQGETNLENKPSSTIEDITSANDSRVFTTSSTPKTLSSTYNNSVSQDTTTPSTHTALNVSLSPHITTLTSHSVFISASKVPITTPSLYTNGTDTWENISVHNASTTPTLNTEHKLSTINNGVSDSLSNMSDENTTTYRDKNSSREAMFSVPLKTLESEELPTVVSAIITDPTQQTTKEEFESFEKEESFTIQPTSTNILGEELGETTSTETVINNVTSVVASELILETDNNNEITFFKSASENPKMSEHSVNLFSSAAKRDSDGDSKVSSTFSVISPFLTTSTESEASTFLKPSNVRNNTYKTFTVLFPKHTTKPSRTLTVSKLLIYPHEKSSRMFHQPQFKNNCRSNNDCARV